MAALIRRSMPLLAVLLLLLPTGAAGEKESAAFFRCRVEEPPPRTRGRYPRPHRDTTYDETIRLGLDWLAKHQSPDGRWDCDRLGGDKGHDVGVTGLALLAFLGAGHTSHRGDHRDTVIGGLTWLLSVQGPDGRFGTMDRATNTFDHAIATMAMAEAFGMTGSPFLRRPAERGVAFIEACRNPGLAWRYGIRRGENDTSVTAFVVSALRSAKAAGLAVPPEAFEGAKAWVGRVTEPAYGKVGYTTVGSPSCRGQNRIDLFPQDRTEALTAAGMLVRILGGEDPRRSELVPLQVERILATLPAWDVNGGAIDMYYWYFGSLALFQVGGEAWETWERTIRPVVIEHQRKQGDGKGSWDPAGAWGPEGGRVYATALMTMIAETQYRYPRIFTDRKKR